MKTKRGHSQDVSWFVGGIVAYCSLRSCHSRWKYVGQSGPWNKATEMGGGMPLYVTKVSQSGPWNKATEMGGGMPLYVTKVSYRNP